MSLAGGSSLHSLLHDIVTSFVHQTDKMIFEARQAGEWVWQPMDQSFAFINDFGALKKLDIHRIYSEELPEVEGPEVPEAWDKPGNLASFSVGSRAAAARSFDGGRHVTGEDREKGEIPPLPPPSMNRTFSDLEGHEVGSMAFLRAMTALRAECKDYHRYSKSKKKWYWKSTPAYTSTKTRKGDPVDTESADILDFAGGQLQRILELAEHGDLQAAVEQAKELQLSVEEHREESSKRPVITKPDLRRLTVNFHPAHCRAMSRALEDGVDPAVLQRISEWISPRLGAKVEEVTGRKVAADSDHWNTKLFHKNFWHHGCERVRYMDEKGVEKTRIRRTAVNLNSSGGLLAHDRLRRTFARMGKDFGDYAPEKVEELAKAETRALERQGCLPGDWEINTCADELMETALKEEGLAKYVEIGFQEFLDHEILRHQSGFGEKLSAKEMAEKKVALAAEIGQLEDAKEASAILGATEGEGIVAAARRAAELANQPPIEKIVEREVVKEVMPQKLLQEHAAAIEKQEQSVRELTAELDAEQRRGMSTTAELSDIAAALQPGVGETVVSAANRISAEAMAAEAKANELKSQVEKIREILKPAPEEDLTAASHRVTKLARDLAAELDVERKKTSSRKEIDEVAHAIIDRMEKSDSKDKWDIGGPLASRAAAFLDWLENEPVRLMEKFKRLVAPIAKEIENWPPAKGLLKFVGWGKSK